MLDDFTDSLYASKSTVAYGDSCQENCVSAVRSLEYVDPRGRLNIGKCWCCRRSIGFTIMEIGESAYYCLLALSHLKHY